MEGEGSYRSDLDNLKATELRLGLPGTGEPEKLPLMLPRSSKRAILEVNEGQSKRNSLEIKSVERDQKPAAKAQIVGWPPIRSYRKNSYQAMKMEAETTGMYVKVSMDGAPYLRKIDLKVYKGYKELREALEDMFKCFSLGEISRMNESNRYEYAITYEDKDGDWMLVGDVPWEMFISSCKRMRIMKGSEARGLGSIPWPHSHLSLDISERRKHALEICQMESLTLDLLCSSSHQPKPSPQREEEKEKKKVMLYVL